MKKSRRQELHLEMISVGLLRSLVRSKQELELSISILYDIYCILLAVLDLI